MKNVSWKGCVFCGKKVENAQRSREHIIPQWLLRLTGSENNEVRIKATLERESDRSIPLSSFVFKACQPCNSRYGSTVEADAQRVIERLVAGDMSLDSDEVTHIFDWLDKVRVGLWLAVNTHTVQDDFHPRFRIDQRISTKDRSIIIGHMNGMKGLQLYGPDLEIFRRTQGCFAIVINELILVSTSNDLIFAKDMGFPYFAETFIANGGNLAYKIEEGTNNTLNEWEFFKNTDFPTFVQSIVDMRFIHSLTNPERSFKSIVENKLASGIHKNENGIHLKGKIVFMQNGEKATPIEGGVIYLGRFDMNEVQLRAIIATHLLEILLRMPRIHIVSESGDTVVPKEILEKMSFMAAQLAIRHPLGEAWERFAMENVNTLWAMAAEDELQSAFSGSMEV